MKAEYREFLCSEYAQAGLQPESVVIGGVRYVIPYIYTQNSKEPLKTFLTDFFDVMLNDYVLYKKYNEDVRYVTWYDGVKNRHLIVPFALRKSELSDDEIVNKIFDKAGKKYKKIIIMAYELKKAYPNMVFERMISNHSFKCLLKAHKKWQIHQKRNMVVYITDRLGSFLSQNPEKITNNLENVFVHILKHKARKWALKMVLCATVETSVFEAINKSSDD